MFFLKVLLSQSFGNSFILRNSWLSEPGVTVQNMQFIDGEMIARAWEVLLRGS